MKLSHISCSQTNKQEFIASFFSSSSKVFCHNIDVVDDSLSVAPNVGEIRLVSHPKLLRNQDCHKVSLPPHCPCQLTKTSTMTKHRLRKNSQYLFHSRLPPTTTTTTTTCSLKFSRLILPISFWIWKEGGAATIEFLLNDSRTLPLLNPFGSLGWLETFCWFGWNTKQKLLSIFT